MLIVTNPEQGCNGRNVVVPHEKCERERLFVVANHAETNHIVVIGRCTSDPPRHACVFWLMQERAAANETSGSLLRPAWVAIGRHTVVVVGISVAAPFSYISKHVVEAEEVRREITHGSGKGKAVVPGDR